MSSTYYIMETEMTKEKKKPTHYIDNKEFLRAISEYRETRLTALEAEEPKPRVTHYLGECSGTA